SAARQRFLSAVSSSTSSSGSSARATNLLPSQSYTHALSVGRLTTRMPLGNRDVICSPSRGPPTQRPVISFILDLHLFLLLCLLFFDAFSGVGLCSLD